MKNKIEAQFICRYIYIIIALVLFTNTELVARKVYYGIHGGYRGFTQYGALNTPGFSIYLGDTIRFFNEYPTNYTPAGENFHTITTSILPPGASILDVDFDSRDEYLYFDYAPNVLGYYGFFCLIHTNTLSGHQMAVGVYVKERPSSICGVTFLINGKPCEGIGLCNSCVGIAVNCECVISTSGMSTIIGCANGLVENTSCSGINNCTSCLGIAKNCACVANNYSTTSVNFTPLSEDDSQLYPNPATEFITVPLRKSLKYNLYVYDANGIEINKFRIENEHSITIDTRWWQKGMYQIMLKYCTCSTPKEACEGANKIYKLVKE